MTTVKSVNLDYLTNSTSWFTTNDLSDHFFFKLNYISDLVLLKIVFDCIISLYLWIKESYVSTIMAVTKVDTSFTNCYFLDLKKFELCFILLYWHKFKTTFCVINKSKYLLALWYFYNILETNWISFIMSCFSINENVVLSDNHTWFSHITSKVKLISYYESKWYWLNHLVTTLWRSWSVNTSHLMKHPIAWSINTFHM
jgi:hypothetical protein